MLNRKNQYNVTGWNVWLPGYSRMHKDDFKMGSLIQRLALISYFVAGVHVGLGENLRHELAHKIESIFWMLRIMKNITGSNQGA